MSNEGFKFQASVKDADGDMVNVRADSAEELDAYLSNFPVAAYAQFKANVRGGQALGGIVQPSPPPQATPAQPQGWGQPATPAPTPAAEPTWASPQAGPANGSPHPQGLRCQGCGTPVQYKSFTSKAGKDIKLWSCPQQRAKDDGHYSEFVK